MRQGPNKLVLNSAKAIHGTFIKTHTSILLLTILEIYQNERILKSEAYLVTQIAPKIHNLFNVLDRNLHRTRRRIVGQGLSDRATLQFEPVLLKQINVFLTKLLNASKESKPVDMSEACKLLGFDVSIELGFGYDLQLQASEANRWIVNAISTSNWRINVYIQFPSLKKLNLEKLLLPILLPKVLRYHRLVTTMVSARRKEEKHARPDLFSTVSEYRDPETGESLSAREMWSEATFLLPAGGDTTATTMTATFFYLSRYPTCYARLVQEIRTTFSDGAQIKAGAKLAGCKYLRACIDETLRISPPVGTTLWRDIPRDGNGAIVIEGHAIPEGTRIGVNVYTIHHNEAYFPNPWVFSPERFLEDSDVYDQTQLKEMRTAFSPFSVGYRSCAGKPLAYLESSVTVAQALWYFDIEVPEDVAEQAKVFEMKDQQGSDHSGPNLYFRPRGDYWKDLGV
jgi:cytochrome P450